MNKNHLFVKELIKLKESSREAVADSAIYNQDPLKQHLHISRSTEDQLIKIINSADDKKPKLIMVCGNVGDGKSHTLSEVLSKEELKDKCKLFRVHNDATESFSPDKDCLETLNDLLNPFSDHELNSNNEKLIIAINLGTLSNFLEQYKDQFSELKKYVDSHGIIENQSSPDTSLLEIFSHINFADYHLFQLSEFGASPGIINALLEKVIEESDNNPIYTAYKESKHEEWGENCIILKNYEFLSEKRYRTLIAKTVTQLAIEFKYIISIRQLLNFVFDVLVPPSISNLSFKEYKNRINKDSLEAKLQHYLPFQIFSNPNLSVIFKGLSLLDPCKNRIEALDDEIVLLHTSNEKQRFFKKLKIVFGIEQSRIEKISEQDLSRYYIRYRFFDMNIIFTGDSTYTEFLEALYWNNVHTPKKQKKYHDYIKDAICRWNGNTNLSDKVMLQIDAPQNKYRVFKNHNISIIPRLSDQENSPPPKLDKFSLELVYRFSNGKNKHTIAIDYALYSLLRRINEGYRPNKVDKNSYIQFSIFVDKLTLSDSEKSKLYIDEVNIDEDIDFAIKLDDYGEITFEKVH